MPQLLSKEFEVLQNSVLNTTIMLYALINLWFCKVVNYVARDKNKWLETSVKLTAYEPQASFQSYVSSRAICYIFHRAGIKSLAFCFFIFFRTLRKYAIIWSDFSNRRRCKFSGYLLHAFSQFNIIMHLENP